MDITIDRFHGESMPGDDDEQWIRRNGEIVGCIRKEHDEVGSGMTHEYRVGRYYVEVWDADGNLTAEGTFEARSCTGGGLCRVVSRPVMSARKAHAAAKRFAKANA